MNLLCLLPFFHRWRPIAATTGFERWRCERCGTVKARVARPLVQQVEARPDLVPNPAYWKAGPGVSTADDVGVSNPWLQRGYANEEFTPPPTTGSRSN